MAVMLTAALGLFACGPSDAEPGGRVLYLRYCAACHGESARGDGPVAASLVTAPPDLTRIAARNEGRFDRRAMLRMIDGRTLVAAHGSREMPVWGAVIEDELSDRRYPAYTTLLHTQALTEYLESIQEP
jgi:mono/diheme cytochrome c family protein